MGPEEVRKLLLAKGALLEGHFLLSSGLHSDRYVQCARAFEEPAAAESLGKALAALCPEKVSAVVSPALGAILIGYEVARSLRVRFLFAERSGTEMSLRRGFSLRPGERVAVVEDVITTGKSTGEVISLVGREGAAAVAALAVVDRSGGKASLGVPIRALLKLPLESWPAPECPLCKAGRPVVKPGSRPGVGA